MRGRQAALAWLFLCGWMGASTLHAAQVIAIEEGPLTKADAAADEHVQADESSRGLLFGTAPFEKRGAKGGHGWQFASGLAGNSHGRFDSRLAAVRGFSRFVALDVAALYSRHRTKSWSIETMGPQIDGLLRYASPLFATPMVGLGLGYERWRRVRDGQPVDHRASATLSALWGVDLALTKHFGLSLLRRQTKFLMARPKSLHEPERDEPRLRLADAIGFRLHF